MTKEQILQDHLASISIAISKIDDTVTSTKGIPTDQLIKHRERRVSLQDAGEYIKYLMFTLKQNDEDKKGNIIAAPDSKIITMQ